MRADVEKLPVHRSFRSRGAVTAPMRAIENVARAKGRWPLTLETRADGAAGALYPRWVCNAAGEVSGSALDPDWTTAARRSCRKRIE